MAERKRKMENKRQEKRGKRGKEREDDEEENSTQACNPDYWGV